MRTKYL